MKQNSVTISVALPPPLVAQLDDYIANARDYDARSRSMVVRQLLEGWLRAKTATSTSTPGVRTRQRPAA